MTSPGDPGHVTGHNTLEDAIRAQAERFNTTVTLTGPYSVGAPNHIGVHNLERQAILDIASAAGVTVTVPDEAELGELGHTSDHDVLTAAVAQLAAAPAWNNATGGTITEVPNYNGTGQTWRIHTFTATGTLTITRNLQPFRTLIVGGGGGRGGWITPAVSGARGGGGGLIENQATTLPTGDLTVSVGVAGSPGGENYQGTVAGDSALNGVVAGGGKSDYNAPDGYQSARGTPPGGDGAATTTSTITGAPVDYCGSNYGGASTRRGQGSIHGNNYDGTNGAIAGTVIVAYQIG